MSDRRRQGAERLSRDRLIEAAVELIDADGVDKLTVRRVAASVDVTPMALYWHFTNKEELLDGVGDALADRLDLSSIEPDSAWDDRLSKLLHTLIDALAEHPRAAEITMRRLLYTDAGKRLAELGLTVLRNAGLSEADAFLVGRYALRTAVAVASEPVFTGADVAPARASRLQHEFDEQITGAGDTFPLLRDMREDMRTATDSRRYREVAVDLLVNGVRHFRSR